MSKKTQPAPAEGEAEEMRAPVQAESEPVQEPPTPKGAGFCCYIGPTIPGVIQSGHIYGGTRADALREIAHITKTRPLAASLLVDGASLAADRIRVKTPGSLLFVNYRKLAAGETK